MDKGCKSESDSIRQNELIDQWTMLQVCTRTCRDNGEILRTAQDHYPNHKLNKWLEIIIYKVKCLIPFICTCTCILYCQRFSYL